MGHGSLLIIVYVGSRGVCSRLGIDCGEEPGCNHFMDILVDLLKGKVEVEYPVRTSLRSLYLEGGQIRKARVGGLVGGLGGFLVCW